VSNSTSLVLGSAVTLDASANDIKMDEQLLRLTQLTVNGIALGSIATVFRFERKQAVFH